MLDAAPPDAAAPARPDCDDPQVLTSRLAVSTAQLEQLRAYRALLESWSGRFNLVGPSVLGAFWGRHVLDSAQLVSLQPKARHWTDIGSGAGFPGLVIAILIADRPGAHVHLIESVGKRCRFLEEVGKQLRLPIIVHQARAEALRLPAEVVTARACAPLSRLLGFALPHLPQNTIGLFLKGRDIESELTAAREQWRLDCELLPSLSDPAGRILKVNRLERA